MPVISLEIPDHAEVGDTLTFVVDGSELDLEIPPGSKPGDILQIQVGGKGNGQEHGLEEGNADRANIQANDTASSEQIEIALYNGAKLRLSTCVPPSQQNLEGNNNHYNDGTHCHAWPAGLALAKFLASEQAPCYIGPLLVHLSPKNNANLGRTMAAGDQTINVIELGSGMGVVGLALAANLPWLLHQREPPPPSSSSSEKPSLPHTQPQLSGHFLLTDTAATLPLLQENVNQNHDIIQNACMGIGATHPSLTLTVEAKSLLWQQQQSSPTRVIDRPGFRLLVASDVLYNAALIPDLLGTVKTLFSDQNQRDFGSAMLLAVRWRKPEVERQFFAALEGYQCGDRRYSWKLVQTSLLPCRLSWSEYGNPDCQASNRYFHQTKVSVRGEPHALSQMVMEMEDADGTVDAKKHNLTERMLDEEAEAFERCQIQIYYLHASDQSEEMQAAAEGCTSTTGSDMPCHKDKRFRES